MSPSDAREILQLSSVLPVVTLDDADRAVPLARAILSGGVRVLEVTLRTPAALDALRAIATGVPELTVGAGSVNRPEQLDDVRDAGGRFAVSPGFTTGLAAAAAEAALPWLPGVLTPSEMLEASAAGCTALKYFPASAGGRERLDAVRGPLPDLTFCPTGGVGRSDFREWLALPNVSCVGGSWLAPREAIAEGDWECITTLCQEVGSQEATCRESTSEANEA